ncbi:MAG: hypothetical protein ACLFTA_03635 [Candidatus Nanohaloarchaea archaeon]
MDTKQQVLMMGGGLMVAIGFMFMGAASLSGLTQSQAPQENEGQEVNVSLPEQHYSEEGFGLSIREQASLAVNDQVVFVTAIYEQNESVFDEIKGLEEGFNDRVYLSTVNASQTQIDNDIRTQEYPEIVVVGDQQTQESPYSVDRADNNRESVRSTICSTMRDVQDVAASCY